MSSTSTSSASTSSIFASAMFSRFFSTSIVKDENSSDIADQKMSNVKFVEKKIVKKSKKTIVFQQFDSKNVEIDKHVHFFENQFRKLLNVLKKKFEFVLLLKRILNQFMKKIIIRDFLNVFSTLAKMFHQKIFISKILETRKKIEKSSTIQIKQKKIEDSKMSRINLLKIENLIISHDAKTNLYIVQIFKIKMQMNDHRESTLADIDVEINLMNLKVIRKCK